MKIFFLFLIYSSLLYNSALSAQDVQQADSLRLCAKILGYNGSFDESIALYDKAISIYKTQNKIEKTILSILDKGLIICFRDDLTIEEKNKVIKKTCYSEENIDIQNLYEPLSIFINSDSIEHPFYQRKKEKIISKINNKCILFKININLSFTYYRLGNIDQSIFHIEEASKYKEKCNYTDPYEEIDLYTFQTALFYDTGELDKALESSMKSILLLETLPIIDTIGLAYEYNNLASIHSELSDEYTAIEYYQKAVDIITLYSQKFPIDEKVTFLNNLAISKKNIGNNNDIKKWALETLKIIERIDNKSPTNWEDLHILYNIVSQEYLENNNPDSALYYTRKALQHIDRSPSVKHSTLEMLHRGLLKVGILDDSKKALDQAIILATKNYGSSSAHSIDLKTLLVDFYWSQNEYLKSLEITQECIINICLNFDNANIYSNPKFNDILSKKTFCDLMSKKIKALTALYQQTPDPKLIDAIYDCTKLATEALVEVNRTFKNTNSKRFWLNQNAIPFYEQAIRTAYTLAQETGNQQYLYEAFQLCEQSKSMLMNDVLQEQQAAALGGVPQELTVQQTELEQLVADAEKARFDAHAAGDQAAEKAASDELFDFKDQLGRLRLRFELDFPEYYKLKYSNDTTTAQDVQAALNEGDCLLEYFEGNDHLYCFIITKNELRVQQLERTAAFNIRLQRFQMSLMNIQQFTERPMLVYNNYVKDGYQLYQELFGDLDLTPLKRLIIVPDGKLSYLPFEVLLDEARQPVDNIRAANFKELPYLFRHFPINYLYSAQLWLQQRQAKQPTNNGKILGLAPTYEGSTSPDWRPQREVTLRQKLINLPGAAAEVAHLKTQYLGKYYSGAAANETQFRKLAGEYSILHLAMHGLIDRTNPEFSGLAMSEDQSQDEDNFLYAYEIKKLPLNADLVVLSACETGIGKYQRGEGVISIGRGFIYAGAPSLLMTLWSLNDDSGAFIMEEFYKNLHAGRSKDEAIQQAKLHYLTHVAPEYAHPFMWAAFVSVGDYSPITLQSPPHIGWYIGGTAGLIALLVLFWWVRSRRKV